jgi:predicted metal-binding protein
MRKSLCTGRNHFAEPPLDTLITLCDTCKRPGHDVLGQARTDGDILAGLVESAAVGRSGIVTRRQSCLLGCDYACNIALQAQGKLTFVLGMFEPVAEAAEAIVAFAAKHAESANGYVPFREWPAGVKGHFRARLPVFPAPEGTG